MNDKKPKFGDLEDVIKEVLGIEEDSNLSTGVS